MADEEDDRHTGFGVPADGDGASGRDEGAVSRSEAHPSDGADPGESATLDPDEEGQGSSSLDGMDRETPSSGSLDHETPAGVNDHGDADDEEFGGDVTGALYELDDEVTPGSPSIEGVLFVALGALTAVSFFLAAGGVI